MPVVLLETNLPDEKFSEEFHLALSKCVADTFHKPESRVSVRLATGQRMSRGGSFDPFLQVQITAIGIGRDSQEGKTQVAAVSKFLTEHSGLALDRVYVYLHPIEASCVGLNGTVASLS